MSLSLLANPEPEDDSDSSGSQYGGYPPLPRSVAKCIWGLSKRPCHSIKHLDSPCSRWRASQDFVRVKKALLSQEHWLYVLLTFNQAKISEPKFAYQIVSKAWEKLKKRLERQFGKFLYVQSWEETEAGYPHGNTLIAGEISKNMTAEKLADIHSWLKKYAPSCGFGYQVGVEPVRDREATASYIVKVTQAPMHSPLGFRRLRPSRGLLPKTFAQLNRDKKSKRTNDNNPDESTPNPAA